MHNQPSGAAFDIVLLLHVACVVTGIVTIAIAAASARQLRRLAPRAVPLSEPLRRYFRPGLNWAGRTIYGIPVFGLALIAMSQGAYAVTDGWVLGGVALFVVLVLLAECALWPAERRLQHVLVAAGTSSGTEEVVPPSLDLSASVTADAARMERAASGALVVLIAATVLMIAHP